MGRVAHLCLACVTWVNPAGDFQNSEGDTATIDGHSATYLPAGHEGDGGCPISPASPSSAHCDLLHVRVMSLDLQFGEAVWLRSHLISCPAYLTGKLLCTVHHKGLRSQ